MKILFIMYDNQSSKNHMPVGPCYVAGYVKANGYVDITYYNQDVYHYPEEHLTEYLSDNHFDVAGIGFTGGYYQYRKIKKICAAIDKAKDRPFVVLGGYGPTPEPAFYISETGADAAVMGEGEVPFLNLLRALERREPLKGIGGLAYRDGDDIIVNGREEPIKDLDDIPFPYYENLPMEYYLNGKALGRSATDRMIYVTASRGCNYKCNFCQRLEKGIRFRSAGNIVEEMQKYKKEYGVTFVQFVDELFMFSKKRVFELTEAFIKADLNIKYFCTGRVNIATPEILGMMKKSGCVSISYGIEQFDNDALKAMDKKQTEEDIVRTIEMTQKAGIFICFDIIFGNLGDTKSSMRKTLDLFKKYNDYEQFRTIRPVTPYPGSALYDYAVKKGLLKGPKDFYDRHKNVELPVVNFTNISDNEYIKLLFEANKEIVNDYYEHMKNGATEGFKKVYFNKDYDFRGVRH